ncbi:MAG: YHS domain-containing protein [Planctomycetota bacterium]|nr:YHS domain-containing protein [Planctomycetota bacterium]
MLSVFNRRQVAGLAVLMAAAMLLAASRSATAQTAAKAQPASSDPALEGYCSVCISAMNKWVRGKAEYQTTHDGKTYYFPSEQQKEMFLADPAKYVPALGGDCTVCLAKMGKRVPGNIRHAALHQHRLFLFPSEDQKKEFQSHPDQYANVDLALDGKCAVCQVEFNKDVPGKPEIAAVHHGLRYLFPAAKQREMFLANPDKYAVKPAATTQTSTQTTDAQLVTVEGKSGCAGCDHGVVPIGSPNELGLAVNARDGTVFVVEDAHKLYPKVYKDRFEGLPLAVTGKVIKRDGKITWIQPTSLKVIN